MAWRRASALIGVGASLLLATALASLQLARGVERTENRGVMIRAGAAGSSEALARSIVRELTRSDLMGDLRARFPRLCDAALSRFELRWRKLVPVSAPRGQRRSLVFVQCSLTHRGEIENAGEILEYCKRRVERALAKRMEGPRSEP